MNVVVGADAGVRTDILRKGLGRGSAWGREDPREGMSVPDKADARLLSRSSSTASTRRFK